MSKCLLKCCNKILQQCCIKMLQQCCTPEQCVLKCCNNVATLLQQCCNIVVLWSSACFFGAVRFKMLQQCCNNVATKCCNNVATLLQHCCAPEQCMFFGAVHVLYLSSQKYLGAVHVSSEQCVDITRLMSNPPSNTSLFYTRGCG